MFHVGFKKIKSKKLLILKTVYQKSYSLKYQNKRFYSHGISFFKMKQSGTHMTSQNVPFNLILPFFFSQMKNFKRHSFSQALVQCCKYKAFLQLLEFMSPDTFQLLQRPKLQSYRWSPR